jgi:DnaA family protein
MNKQLALSIQLNQQTSLDDYYWGENTVLQRQINDSLQGGQERLFYLWGDPGCGKSHLLQGCCQSKQGSAYLPLSYFKELGPDCLEGMEEQDLIAIDDIDAIVSDKKWEEALFHLYNKVRDNGHSILLISGKSPPSGLTLQLEDLRSRIAWGLVIHLKELNDDLKVMVLQQQAKKRGFTLANSVVLFLINRCARNMHHLLELLDTLDAASLAAQRKITLPFVKRVLGI